MALVVTHLCLWTGGLQLPVTVTALDTQWLSERDGVFAISCEPATHT